MTFWKTMKSQANLILNVFSDSEIIEPTYDCYVSGDVPLTLTNSVGKTLTDWSITGDTVQNGTPSPENLVEVKGVGDRTRNLFDISAIEIGAIRGTTGLVPSQFIAKQYTDYRFIRIKCKPNTNYTFSCLNNVEQTTFRAINCEEQEITISMLYEFTNIPKGIVEKTFTTENTAEYIYIQIHKDSTNIMLNEGSEPLPYEPYGVQIPVLSRGKNLYDDSETVFVKGRLLDDNGNEVVTASSQYTQNFTKVYGDSFYTVSGKRSDSTTAHRIYFYDANKNFINRTEPLQNNTATFKTPINCRYIRYQSIMVATDSSMWQTELGSTATEYEPYRQPITTTQYIPTPLMANERLTPQSREVKYKAIRLTSDMGWLNNSGGTGRFTTTIAGAKNPTSQAVVADIYCSHLPCVSANELYRVANPCIALNSSSSNNVWIQRSYWDNNPDNFKKWLDDNEVYLYYPLATPTTEPVTTTPIGTFDEECWIDVDTEVKPVSMSATYKSSKPDNDMQSLMELFMEV